MTAPIGTPGEWAALLGLLLVLPLLEAALSRFTRERSPLVYDLSASAVWTLIALAFGWWVQLHFGGRTGLTYVTAYSVERALSFDNLFVFIVIFDSFGVPDGQRPRLLRWGVIGAVAARGALIGVGATLIARLQWLLPILGVLLVVTGIRVALRRRGAAAIGHNSLLSKISGGEPPRDPKDGRFLIRREGRWIASTLLVALLVIELSDIIFAVDSIPAVFGITRSPYIAFSSNAFALMGLRALFGLAALAMKRLSLLHHGVGLVLVFVGATMVAGRWWHAPELLSLAVILTILGVSIAASLATPQTLTHPASGTPRALRPEEEDG
jgi:tellurite resistance protein TerC